MGPRLASLTLEGFKSFAARAELAFPSPITAIVGPNGSGKSNICDAIAWVLGEQSARLLRSQTMSDVIFAGSPDRIPGGAATVALTLAASDGRWAQTDGKLVITRRVSRDGTSEYRLGGRRTRLKDILDHLMDVGIGTRAYAIIEQGRIGQVLSVRATERRALFEEAAGITKFRARRHEAELKLTETRANLLRLSDVAAEVRRALDAARRQARRAERHRELRHELLEVKASLLAARRVVLTADLESRRAASAEAQGREAEAAGTLGGVEARLEALRRELDAAQESLGAAREETARLDAAGARREAEEAAARREFEEASRRRDAAAAESQRLGSLAGRGAVHEAELAAALEVADAARREREEEAGAAAVTAGEADTAARAAIAQAEEARRRLLSGAAAATEARNRVHRAEVELEQCVFQRTRMGAEHERLSVHLAEAAEREQQTGDREREAGEHARQVDASRRELQGTTAELARRSEELAAGRDRVAHERWQVRHELEGLQRQLAASRAVPQAVAKNLPDEKILGTLADFLEPPADVAPLLDRAYGDLLNIPVLADAASLAALREGRLGIEGRLEVAVAVPGLEPRPSPLLQRAGAAPEHLGWISRTLPRAVVAEDAAEAERLAVEDPDLVVVLPDAGRRSGLRVELPGRRQAVPGALELRVRERRASTREAELAADEERLGAELATVKEERAEVAQRLAAADGAAREAAEHLAATASAHEALQRERSRLQRELEAVVAETARLEQEAASLRTQLDTFQQEAERLSKRAGSLEGEVDTLVRAADAARERSAAAATEAERQRGAASLAAERSNAARRELERHRREIADLRERQRVSEEEKASQHTRAQQAAAAAATARADLAELLAQGTAAHRAAETATAREAELKTTVAAASTETERDRTAHLAARDEAHNARVALAEANGALERLHEAIALTLGDAVELPAEPPEAPAIPGLEEREAALSASLETLGPVNELAVSERDELEERHRFLQEQRRDLERSLESLGETVGELDSTCAERFLATLEEASAAFGAVFQQLFGGGDATVELSDPDNPLESGIEIRVRPPGKHAQSVLLLSGGEKALAAVALLLALFRIRPAPFCVLDEVDAPLDDANVERLCRLLQEMSGDTQFLLITHNRRTMAHADVLYGVTMQEPGVSRIVSVRMED